MDHQIANEPPGTRSWIASVGAAAHARWPMLRVIVPGLTLATASAAFMYPNTGWSSQSSATNESMSAIVIQDYQDGLTGVRASNPDVKLSVSGDPALGDQPVLLVEYPAPTGNPGGRDVWCIAENQDWSAGRAIAFHVKPARALRMSLSFMDRNRVAYTTWKDLIGGEWQEVRIAFDEIRPNPYFQPPDAKKDAPIDVSGVRAIGFAPQDETAGHLAIGRFVVVE
jgi:hypothetical protein